MLANGDGDVAAFTAASAAWARQWLFECALPLWSTAGVDRRNGGFVDKLALDGGPVDEPQRLRVQARQVFVFARVGELGWSGPADALIEHGLQRIASLRRPDGLYASTAAGEVDLYDQAFVLLALASAYAARGRPDALRREAEALLAILSARLAHPLGGFEEASPRRLPLRSNPHMHLLEALLAWVAAGVRGVFERVARQIVELAHARLIDHETGSIGEYYDGDWRPQPGEGGVLREPGHQFEWAYLLWHAADLLPLAPDDVAGRLAAFGGAHGVREGYVLFAVDRSGRTIDANARLWAQTEHLRTMTTLAGRAQAAERPAALARAEAAFATVRHFLESARLPGLWRERRTADGSWLDEPVPASSLYHILTGFEPILAATPAINHRKGIADRGKEAP